MGSSPGAPARTVLLTGGRAPCALELARVLADAGCTVHVAESLPWTVTALSRHARAHRVPPPRQQPDAFTDALLALIEAHDVDLLIPTCEEVFWVARDVARLSRACVVPVLPRDRLADVHHKGRLPHLARQAGVPAPETRTVHDAASLGEAVRDLGEVVVKPAWSRFGTRVLRRPTARQLDAVTPTDAEPWVVQAWCEGPEWCTWSLAHDGHLRAHACYAPRFTVDAAAVAFTHIDRPDLREHVARFVATHRWTGAIAFDWREHDGEARVIEANPRGTSGIHLLARVPGFAGVLRDLGDGEAAGPVLEPTAGEAAQVGLAMVLHGLGGLPHTERGPWWSTLRTARDVLWRTDDPAPLLLGLASYAALAGISARYGTTMLEASTRDIQWDGEP